MTSVSLLQKSVVCTSSLVSNSANDVLTRLFAMFLERYWLLGWRLSRYHPAVTEMYLLAICVRLQRKVFNRGLLEIVFGIG